MDTNIPKSIEIFSKFVANENVESLIKNLQFFERDDLKIELQVLIDLIEKVQQEENNS